MAIDSSIYRGMASQTPDIMGAVDKGLRMRDLMDQRKERSAISDAFKKHTTVGPDGKVNVDRGLVMKDLYAASPEAAMRMNEQFQTQDARDAQMQANRVKSQMENLQMSNQLVSSATDQNTWTMSRNKAIEMGLAKPNELPEVFDPKFRDYLAGATMTQMERLNQQFRVSESERDQKNKELDRGLEREKLYGKHTGGLKLTKAQEVVDSEFGKEYAGWTSGGRDGAYSEIEKLKSVAANLKSGKVTTGGLTGTMPDRLTSKAVLEARADVQSTVMNSLRAILGAQFTEKEGERIIKNTWNESDATENNLARVNRLVADLEAKAAAKDSKSQFYEEAGSLRGYKAGQAVAGRRQPVMTPGNREINILPAANAGVIDHHAITDDAELYKYYKSQGGK